MIVKEILVQWLKDNGYDGLVASKDECGCRIDDLIMCQEPCDNCRPGYLGPDPEGESEWAIFSTREAAKIARREFSHE